MAYLGEKPISSDHPFAQPTITVGQPKPPPPPDGKTATLIVEWGYDLHWLELNADQWYRVRCGEELVVEGPGYLYENHPFQDIWIFNGGEHGLVVLYSGENVGDDGVGYNGSLSEAQIEEHAAPLPTDMDDASEMARLQDRIDAELRNWQKRRQGEG